MRAIPTCLELVNRVLFECGVPEVAALGNRESRVALEAMNDATADVWIRQRWTFQRNQAFLTLVASQADYALPADFDRMAHTFRTTGSMGYVQLKELSPEEWYDQASTFISSTGGQPMMSTVRSTTVTLSPAPSAEFIAICPLLEYWYFKTMPNRRTTSDGASSWDLPLDFYDVLVTYGKSKLKAFLEASPADINADMAEYERKLEFLRNKYRLTRPAPTFKTRNQQVMEW